MAIDPGHAHGLADAALPVVAQPGFLIGMGHELASVPLPAPLRLMPLRALLDAGVELAFSSDYPAADLSPWAAVQAAATRLDGTGRPIHPDEALTVAEALDAHTRVAAGILGLADAGTLEPGMRADLLWCDRDPHRTDPARLTDVCVLATWRAGVRLYAAPEEP